MKARKTGDPAIVVAELAEKLKSTMREGHSCSLFYGAVDRRDFSLSYCLLGKIVALHYDYAGQRLNRLEPIGSALGQVEPSTLKTEKIALNSRDRLIICSTGFLRLKNKDGEYFGEERLFQMILDVISKDVHEVRNEILFRATSFIGDVEVPNDLTVLVAEVKDRVIKLAKSSPKK